MFCHRRLEPVYSHTKLTFDPFTSSGFFCHNSLDRSIWPDVWIVFYDTCFIEISVFNENNVDPDQTPRSAASDLALHYLSVILLGVSRLKWVKVYHDCSRRHFEIFYHFT